MKILPIRTWSATYIHSSGECRSLGIYEARVGQACQRAMDLWPTHYASGRVILEREGGNSTDEEPLPPLRP
jgi:hypothetical protein